MVVLNHYTNLLDVFYSTEKKGNETMALIIMFDVSFITQVDTVLARNSKLSVHAPFFDKWNFPPCGHKQNPRWLMEKKRTASPFPNLQEI